MLFFHNSIVQRFILLAVLQAAIVVVGVAWFGFQATGKQMHSQLDLQMQAVANDLSFFMHDELSDMLDNLTNLAGNPIVANALVDDVGRERYISQFFSNISSVSGLEVHAALTDYRGHPIAGEFHTIDERLKRELVVSIEQNQTALWLSKSDDEALLLILMAPVIYANTGMPEGALLYVVKLQPLFELLMEHSLYTSGGDFLRAASLHYVDETVELQGVMSRGDAEGSSLLKRQQVSLPEQLQQSSLQFEVTTVGNPEVFASHQRILAEHYLTIGSLALLMAILFAYPMALLLLKRLTRLQRSASEMIASDDIGGRLPQEGHDEVARLALAFNAVLYRLEQAYKALESAKDETIAEQEAKYQAVMDQASEAMLLWNRRGQLVEANRAASTLLDISHQQLMRKQVDDLLVGGMERLEGDYNGKVWESELHAPGGRSVAVEIASAWVMVEGQPHNLWLIRDIQDRLAAREVREQYKKYLEELAFYDPLTHLPNRRMLTDRLQQLMAVAQRKKEKLAVCYLDLDSFKPVNDSLGHKAGDEVLLEVAKRLKEITRVEDTVARLGGDEFVLLLGGFKGNEECIETLERIMEALSLPHLMQGWEFLVSASIGVTLYPDDHEDADTLIRHADQAMYMAKQRGRRRFHFFDREKDNEAQDRQALLQELTEAIEQDQLCLHYQPKVDMANGRVLGAEALVRWQHPSRGLLPPGAFLPIAVGHMISQQLDWWVLDKALAQLTQWYCQGLTLELSINVSASTMQAEGFLPRLQALLDSHPELPRTAVQLEILESEIIDDLEKVAEIVAQCNGIGIRVSLDDFGTGYSSLLYFRRLPVHELKIDQTFVRDVLHDSDDLSIVQSVIRLADAFDRAVVAEGVETLAHGTLLRSLGCNVAQGYGIARPMPAEALPDWVRGYRAPEIWVAQVSPHLWSKLDTSLLLVEAEHWMWIDQLAAVLEGSNATPPELEKRACRFGQWYYGEGLRRFGKLPEFIDLEGLHDEVHRVAEALLAQREEDPLAAQLQISVLYESRDALLAMLHKLQLGILRGEFSIAV